VSFESLTEGDSLTVHHPTFVDLFAFLCSAVSMQRTLVYAVVSEYRLNCTKAYKGPFRTITWLISYTTSLKNRGH